MRTVVVVPIEPIPSRYTSQWIASIPVMLMRGAAQGYKVVHESMVSSEGIRPTHRVKGRGLIDEEINICSVFGAKNDGGVTDGAFLDFGYTQVWKATQMVLLAQLLKEMKDGDAVFVTDAWNPQILSIRYMIDLLGKDIKLHGQWHAGYHDPHDQLRKRIDAAGRGVAQTRWALTAEQAFARACDVNYFATKFYADMFQRACNITLSSSNSVIAGLPMGYLQEVLTFEKMERKEKLVVFPHRIAEEKNIDVFRAMQPILKERGIEAVVAMEVCKNKEEYHDLLARAAVVVSMAEQETFGISMYEGVMSGCIPVVPECLSYTEMYQGEGFNFLYPAEKRTDAQYLADWCTTKVNTRQTLADKVAECRKHLLFNYTGDGQITQSIIGGGAQHVK